jgi:N-acetylmuramoyl-L-alanine amidase
VQLQTRLAELRYDVGPVDRTFGISTKHAVIAFQKINGLTRDGIVGPNTHAALNRPVVRKVRRVRTGTYLEVDLTRQVVLLAKDGKVTHHRCLDREGRHPTPVGAYRIDGYRTGALGTMWRPAYSHRGMPSTVTPPSPPTPPATAACA